MTTILRYNFVASSEEDGVLTVGFADDQFDTQEYFLFQAWLDAEAEGEKDEIYLERDGQEQGTYGGVERLVLKRDCALLTVSSETAEALRTEREIQILFSVNDEQYQQLVSGLHVVFANDKCFELHG